MHRNDSANEGGGGSSPETVIARSSSEDDPRRITAASNRESSSSLETPSSGVLASSAGQLLAAQEKRKKSRFGSLKSSFRKDGGLFKLKKNKNKNVDVETAVEAEPEPEEEKGAKSYIIYLNIYQNDGKSFHLLNFTLVQLWPHTNGKCASAFSLLSREFIYIEILFPLRNYVIRLYFLRERNAVHEKNRTSRGAHCRTPLI